MGGKKKKKKTAHSVVPRWSRAHAQYIVLPCPALLCQFLMSLFLPTSITAQDCDSCSRYKHDTKSTRVFPLRIDPRGWYSTWLAGWLLSMAKIGESDAGHAWGGSLGVLTWTTFARPMPPQAQGQ